MFAIAGQEYEDVRHDQENWAALKASMPFGQIPVLEVKQGDEVTFIAQSFAIFRFLARQFKLDGKDEAEKAQVDMMVEQYIDLQNAFIKHHFEQDEQAKKDLAAKLFSEIVPQNLAYFEKILAANKSNSGWYVGESISLVDVVAFNIWEWVRDHISEIVAKFPLVKANDDKVKSLPQISEWLAKRPASDL